MIVFGVKQQQKKDQKMIDLKVSLCRMRASLNGKLLSEPFIESV